MEQKQLVVVVALILNDKGEILLGQRNEPKIPEIHNKWEFFGGKVEFGEDPEAAIIREVKEEAGVDVKVISLLPKIYSNTWDKTPTKEGYQAFLLPYRCQIISGGFKKQDEEISNLKYFPIKDINYDECLPKTKEIIELLNS